MKNYFYAALLILVSSALVVLIPSLTDFTQEFLISFQIPENSSNVAGVQKYVIPPSSLGLPLSDLSARAVLVLDLPSGTVLYQKNADTPLPIASTTKIMTALVSSRFFRPNSVLTVKDGANIPGANIGLREGESLTFRSLLYGMLLNSGNDAAFTIAENYPGEVLGFVSAMNKKALDLGLKNTHFTNPAGLDSPQHFSSTRDLARITEEALKDSQLTRIFATKETQVVSLDQKQHHNLKNLNKLLSQVAGVLGVKTGYTDEAKENLVTLVDRNAHKVLLVVLGSDDRFGESTKLIDWTYNNFQWE